MLSSQSPYCHAGSRPSLPSVPQSSRSLRSSRSLPPGCNAVSGSMAPLSGSGAIRKQNPCPSEVRRRASGKLSSAAKASSSAPSTCGEGMAPW